MNYTLLDGLLSRGYYCNKSDFQDSFSGSLPAAAYHLDFLDEYLSKESQLFVHRSTGVVSSGLKMSPSEVASYWTNQIFKSESDEDYSALRPFARARLAYCAYTLLDYFVGIGYRPKSICDFATGQAILPPLLQNLFDAEISTTEASRELVCNSIRQGFPSSQAVLGEGFKLTESVSVGTLTWTLCNCINPLAVLSDINTCISEYGYLMIADSSRLMVPFKKTLQDLLPACHPLDIHPYIFSARTLCSLAMVSGFIPVYLNRYWDSDVMLAIFRKDTNFSRTIEKYPCEDPEVVRDFFTRYNHYSKYFAKADY